MKSTDSIVRNGIVYSANMYHWRQEISRPYPEHTQFGEWGFYLCANIFDEATKAPVKIKRVSVIMGNHPNYFPGWDIARDARMFSENSSSHCIGPWYVGAISEDSVGGGAYFDLEDGTHLKIEGLRLEKPGPDWSIGPIPIISIPFSLPMLPEMEEIKEATSELAPSSEVPIINTVTFQLPPLSNQNDNDKKDCGAIENKKGKEEESSSSGSVLGFWKSEQKLQQAEKNLLSDERNGKEDCGASSLSPR